MELPPYEIEFAAASGDGSEQVLVARITWQVDNRSHAYEIQMQNDTEAIREVLAKQLVSRMMAELAEHA